jgi:hypothetical protein
MKSRVTLSFYAATVLSPALLGPASAQNRTIPDVLVFEQPGNQWFEALYTSGSVSNDGNSVLFSGLHGVQLYSLATGREDANFAGGLDQIYSAIFCGPGALARRGRRGSENGWFLPGGEMALLSLPHNGVVACSADGSKIAYVDVSEKVQRLFIRTRGNLSSHALSERATATTSMSFSPDGGMLYYLVFEPSMEASFVGIAAQTGISRIIARHLDACPWSSHIEVAPDGKHAYLVLASDGAPNNEARHQPDASRWLKIYEIDLVTGGRRRIVDLPGTDNTSPIIAKDNLFWTRTLFRGSIAWSQWPAERGRK